MVCRRYITKSLEVVAILIIHYNEVASEGEEELLTDEIQVPPSEFLIRNPTMQPDFVCRPGRTYIKTVNNKHLDSENLWNELRKMDIHQLSPCSVCLCSSDGKKEDCMARLGENTNECVRMALLTQKADSLKPHEYWRSLFYRIRRGGQANEAKWLRSMPQCEPFKSRFSTCLSDSTVERCRTCHCNENARWRCHRSQRNLVEHEINVGLPSGAYDGSDDKVEPSAAQTLEYSIPPRGYPGSLNADSEPILSDEDPDISEQDLRAPHYVRSGQSAVDPYPVGVVHTFYL